MKYQAKTQNLDILFDPSFQGVKRLFDSSFKNENDWESYKRYFLPTIEIKYYNVMIDEIIFFWSTKKKKRKKIIWKQTYDNIQKSTNHQWDDYTTGCSLEYPFFKDYYKLIAINPRKQQTFDVDLKAIQQINFTENLEWDGNTQMFL